VFERFTERARQVVVLAQEEARTLRHNYIGTEHILLGLLRDEAGLAARVLESLDITLERVRAQVVRIVGPGEEVTEGQIPFTPRAKKVLELALREALSLGHNYIGTEHILLGMTRENEGVAARILLDFDADAEKIRNEVIRMLSGSPPRAEGGGERPRAVLSPEAGASREGRAMAVLEREIRARLARDPDNGDLLVILASVPQGVVARALVDLGVDDAALDAALARARAQAPDDIEQQIAAARRDKDAAIDEDRLQDAATARARERELVAANGVDLIGRVRSRLGLAG
jgi:hypothetical protein